MDVPRPNCRTNTHGTNRRGTSAHGTSAHGTSAHPTSPDGRGRPHLHGAAARIAGRGRRMRAVAIGLAALATAGALTACEPTTTPTTTTTTTTPTPVAPGPGDGLSMETAGASCWGILRDRPASASGTYWLSTPAMDRPAPFYCDMTTDGGGWVLIGRGREGWTFEPTGQQSPATVRSTVSGSGAFAPATLDTTTVNALINGASPAALSDGIRVERATNSAGTSKQQLRLYPKFTTWNWTWQGGHALSKITLDGTTYSGSNTFDTFSTAPGSSASGLNGKQGTQRMFTWAWANNGNKAGFSFGSGGPKGSTSSTNNLYQHSTSGYTLPFTRIWLRPRIANAVAYPAIPSTGYTASTKPAVLKDRSELARWGVVGLNHTDEANVEPWNTNVLALEASPTRVFVGGRFTGVQQGPTGSAQSQPSLAAFDLEGNWISTFRPVVAGRVWDMVLTPDDKLIIAGDFTSVNGVANTRGLAALDPTTGAVISGWRARISRVSGSEWRVRALDLRGSYVYAVGLFDRLMAGTATVPVAVSNAAAVAVSDGAQGPWQPTLANGSGMDVAATRDGTRVLVAGNFSSIGGSTTHGYFGVTAIGTGAPVSGVAAWTPSAADREKYQQAVADLGTSLIVGGSEHSLQRWNAARTSRWDAAIAKPGGDIQAIEVVGSKVYVGCHCGGWVYEGTNSYASPSGFRAISPINLVGMWDTATWTLDRTWFPAALKGASGEGVWAMDTDVNGCLWVGGDLNRGAYSGDAATDWLGGFARFCAADATAPSAPTALALATSGSSRTLTWGASTDPGGATITYDVIRDGRVIATTSAATRTYTDASAPAGSTYTVRAVDGRGNRSASPPPKVAG